jgi:acyl-CoA thioesterase-2
MPASAQELLDLLVLEDLDVDLYRGPQPHTVRQRVFGGQVAGQAVLAASRSVDDALAMHSMHSYFLRPGDTAVPIIYDVERIRDGRSFVTRRVVARQHGRPIYYLTASFQKAEEGFEHQDRMPDVAPPEAGISMADLARRAGPDSAEAWQREWAALDIRHLGHTGMGMPEDADHPAQARVWLRIAGPLGDDAVLHRAAFTYASDMTLLGASLVPHGVHIHEEDKVMPASLDHSIWFHQPFRADDWWLYDQTSPVARGGRGLATARVFTQDGRLVATVAQEGLVRPRR